MARAATTTDAFNAVAEPRRRQILDVLAAGERSVNDLVAALEIPQPLMSKHLRVLREVDLVIARDDGRQRLYRLNGIALRPIYDWVRNSNSSGRSASPGWTSCLRNSSRQKRSTEMTAMTNNAVAVVTLPSDTEILITRDFDAPRRLVYRTWTMPS